MKYLAIAFLVSCSISLYGQDYVDSLKTKVSYWHTYSMEDTVPIVIYNSVEPQEKLSPAIFINGQNAKTFRMVSLHSENIKNIEIVKDTFEIDNSIYYGKIMIELDKDYNPKLISINDLIAKYTNLNSIPDIIMINNEIVSSDFDIYTVDERDILQIVVQNIESLQNSMVIRIVNLITRTKENVEKANEIIIR